MCSYGTRPHDNILLIVRILSYAVANGRQMMSLRRVNRSHREAVDDYAPTIWSRLLDVHFVHSAFRAGDCYIVERAMRANLSYPYVDRFVKGCHRNLDSFFVREGLVDALGSSGDTALSRALREQDCFRAHYLLTNGANPNATRRTFEAFASMPYVPHIDVITLLVAKGFDVGQTDKDGNNVLHLANHRLISHLLAKGYAIDVNKPNNRRHTPLLLHASQNNVPEVRLLLNAGCDPNASLPSGLTAFHIACMSGNTGLIDAFLEHPNVDVNKADNRGIRPLTTLGRRQTGNKSAHYALLSRLLARSLPTE